MKTLEKKFKRVRTSVVQSMNIKEITTYLKSISENLSSLIKKDKEAIIKENNIKLGIDNLFNIEDKINLSNILFDFHLFNLSFDFLFPYVAKLTSSMKLFFDTAENSKNSNILEKKIKEPIRISYKGEDEVVSFRKFYNIQPLYNEKKKTTKIFGIEFGGKTIMTDLSFTINPKKKKIKKK